MEKLGKLKKVDLRTYWKSEDRDFTPWLAEEENIKELSDAIGIDLEVEQVEQRIGNFNADIIARDTFVGSKIVIENQLEKTDHKHLGQIITYAAGIEADIMIWICKKATEEHTQAVDWLNTHTNEDVHFFLCEIELYVIGDSKPAPKFNVIAKPNEWAKQVKSQTRATTPSKKAELIRRRINSDTIVVPAQDDGFKKVFIGENSWYSIRLAEKMIPQIKYIAAYRVAPISGVTHLAEVDTIEPCKKSPSKYFVSFKEPATKLKETVKIGLAPQGPVYDISTKFLKA